MDHAPCDQPHAAAIGCEQTRRRAASNRGADGVCRAVVQGEIVPITGYPDIEEARAAAERLAKGRG